VAEHRVESPPDRTGLRKLVQESINAGGKNNSDFHKLGVLNSLAMYCIADLFLEVLPKLYFVLLNGGSPNAWTLESPGDLNSDEAMIRPGHQSFCPMLLDRSPGSFRMWLHYTKGRRLLFTEKFDVIEFIKSHESLPR